MLSRRQEVKKNTTSHDNEKSDRKSVSKKFDFHPDVPPMVRFEIQHPIIHGIFYFVILIGTYLISGTVLLGIFTVILRILFH
jgi:hypothetical protein